MIVTIAASATYEQALERAAERWGVQREYWDIWGKHHRATPEMIAAVLQSLGVESGSREDLDAALAHEVRAEWQRLVPPTIVADAATVRIPVRLRSEQAVDVEIAFEDGSREARRMHGTAVGQAEIDGTSYVELTVDLGRLPLGYHEVTVRAEGESPATARLIACPDKAYFPKRLADNGRAAGVGFSLYGIRSERNWGCGDFTDLENVTEWVANKSGSSFVALNPLHSIPNRQPFNTSPYLPNCAFYKNPIYVDIERVPEFRSSAWAQKLVHCSRVQDEIRALRDAENVEYERVFRLKKAVLKAVFRTFLGEIEAKTERAQAFLGWVEQEGELLDNYSVFCALDEVLRKRDPNLWLWQDWPEFYRCPTTRETAKFAREHRRLVLFFKYLQWIADEQLGAAQRRAEELGMAIGLYHDLALATDRSGADLWAHKRFYAAGCRVGAPPDDFAPNGQDWSFPPPSAEEHYRDGYHLFVESIRKNLKHGGALRIDHVMRFFRLFWIPDDFDASRGVYVKDRSEDLLRILALESVRNKVIIVGEDLGTVGDDIREQLHKFGILSYRLFYFERWQDGTFKRASDYPKQALVSSSTHDLPTLTGFWEYRDIDARRRAGVLGDENAYQAQLRSRDVEKQRILDGLHTAGLLPSGYPHDARHIPEFTGELHHAIVGFLASTPSSLMLLSEEDLFKQNDQQNLPGTTAEYPNWRHKTRFTVEQMMASQEAIDFAGMFRGWLERTGRLNG